MLDPDADGSVTPAEVAEALHEMCGLNVTADKVALTRARFGLASIRPTAYKSAVLTVICLYSQVLEIVSKVEENGDGELNFGEFSQVRVQP